jgi:hypothetical protein
MQRPENKCISVKHEGKFFVIGVIIGCLFSYIWQGMYFNHTIESFNIETIKEDTDIRLISYIEGRWSSSIGDVIVEIDPSEKKDFIVIELIEDKHTDNRYKITDIEKINGLMGIVKMNICKADTACTKDEIIPIQFNKIFGKDRTITISYDSRLTYCVDPSDECTRAFKRIK